MYYPRRISTKINQLKKGFPVISVIGPRQSGKTTFLQHYFPGFSYFNLENPSTRQLIDADPKQFLNLHPQKIIIDEVQRSPDLLSYIQTHVDANQVMGSIIISGSQNLLVSEKISQSLAGRAAYQTIFPFSLTELTKNKIVLPDQYSQIIKGFYPAVYSRDIDPNLYYNQYLATYIERDARLIKNIQNLSQFQKFIGLVAGRVGQVVNLSSLASDAGISPNTAQDWLSILEASFIVYQLQPYYKNLGKRMIKSPKIFFYDTGVLCALLNISSTKELINYFNIGSIFENFIISEFKKEINETSKSANLYFYRDNHGHEIDLVVDTGGKLIPVEIKSATTYNSSFFNNFDYWRKHIDPKSTGYLVYGGNESHVIKNNSLISWQELAKIFNKIS